MKFLLFVAVFLTLLSSNYKTSFAQVYTSYPANVSVSDYYYPQVSYADAFAAPQQNNSTTLPACEAQQPSFYYPAYNVTCVCPDGTVIGSYGGYTSMCPTQTIGNINAPIYSQTNYYSNNVVEVPQVKNELCHTINDIYSPNFGKNSCDIQNTYTQLSPYTYSGWSWYGGALHENGNSLTVCYPSEGCYY